jgi:oxygen-independent coproporphyrinogen-3 oxidase
MRSLYVHFPFCEAKCHYCDFYSLGRERTRDGDAELFEAALERECRLEGHRLAPQLDSIFFGGGTPSMTPARAMARALAPLGLEARVTRDTEWTMEANPSSVSLESLREYRTLGVNRISMGVQALRADLLERLGRVHSREAALRALDAIFEAGFTNVSVDLLCGVPGQSLQDVEAAMETLSSYPITHLSCYLLTLAPHHAMHRELPDEETQLEHLLLIDRCMTGRGFEHYEISNFARPGHRARHNLSYWKGASYLGLGPSAHSYDAGAGARWKNVSSLHRYGALLRDGKPVRESTELLTEEQRELERWMLALRLDEGFPREWIQRPDRAAKARAFREQGWLEDHPGEPSRVRLTPRGFALSDQIVSALA